MRFIWLGILGLVIIAIFFFVFLKTQKTNLDNPTPKPILNSEQPTSINQNIQAEFTIITGNITRNFSNPKYHHQSADVYIEKENPHIIHVKKNNITWQDFFNTLPMNLTNQCLLTGDGEKLCDGESGKLEFFLNGKNTPSLLNQIIKSQDKALIIYQYN